jgi:hypothetical protein
MKSILKYLIILPILLISFSCDETAEGDSSTGAMVGTWQLTALSGTYIRDVAVPSGVDASTTYDLKVTWPLAATFLGNASAADQTLATYTSGDNLLNTTSDAADAIAADLVALVGEFKSNDTYTLAGTYPALRIVEAACSTYQTIADIDDDGSYNITYNTELTAGTLSITPLPGTEQVLPSFADGTVTFSDEGQTMNIVFLDRDAHDSLIVNIGETWVEADNRVTMGIAAAYVNTTDNSFTTDATQPQGSAGYLKSAALGTWSYFYTYNAVMMTGCIAGGTSEADCAAAGYGVDDSGHDFDPTDASTVSLGGKLTMEIVSVCIPINETIGFNATFAKQ